MTSLSDRFWMKWIANLRLFVWCVRVFHRQKYCLMKRYTTVVLYLFSSSWRLIFRIWRYYFVLLFLICVQRLTCTIRRLCELMVIVEKLLTLISIVRHRTCTSLLSRIWNQNRWWYIVCWSWLGCRFFKPAGFGTQLYACMSMRATLNCLNLDLASVWEDFCFDRCLVGYSA